VTLHIGPVLVEVTKDKTISTVGYNGQVPGRLIRMQEGKPISVQVFNDTDTPEFGHDFYVVGLDGNPVPRPDKVKTLQLGAAERVDAIVEMKYPGVWILGTPKDEDRNRGMGIVVEYANQNGKPQWHHSGKSDWNYLLFGDAKPVTQPDQVIWMEIGKINGGKGGFNIWTINGQPYNQSAAAVCTWPLRLITARSSVSSKPALTESPHSTLTSRCTETKRWSGYNTIRPTSGIRRSGSS
jgi:FtsP/CotA-like multicopper oxidase with cupredoxin domain